MSKVALARNDRDARETAGGRRRSTAHNTGQICRVCTNEHRTEIDAALVSETPLRTIAERFGSSASALFRHKAKHVTPAVEKANKIAGVDKTLDILAAQETNRKLMDEASIRALPDLARALVTSATGRPPGATDEQYRVILAGLPFGKTRIDARAADRVLEFATGVSSKPAVAVQVNVGVRDLAKLCDTELDRLAELESRDDATVEELREYRALVVKASSR